MRYAHTAFVLALARVTTRAYGSLVPAIAMRYAGGNIIKFPLNLQHYPENI